MKTTVNEYEIYYWKISGLSRKECKMKKTNKTVLITIEREVIKDDWDNDNNDNGRNCCKNKNK